jgi:hypothetical protein
MDPAPDMDSAPDPALSVNNLKMLTKNIRILRNTGKIGKIHARKSAQNSLIFLTVTWEWQH